MTILTMNGNPHRIKADELLSITSELLESKDWKFELVDNETSLSSMTNAKSPLKFYLADTVINKSCEELANKIWLSTEESAKRYDPKIDSWREVERGDNWRICDQ